MAELKSEVDPSEGSPHSALLVRSHLISVSNRAGTKMSTCFGPHQSTPIFVSFSILLKYVASWSPVRPINILHISCVLEQFDMYPHQVVTLATAQHVEHMNTTAMLGVAWLFLLPDLKSGFHTALFLTSGTNFHQHSMSHVVVTRCTRFCA